MTLTTDQFTAEVSGDGVSVTFVYPYRYDRVDDITVTVFDALGEARFPAFVAVGADAGSGATVTLTDDVPLPGETIVLSRQTRLLQAVDYEAGNFPSALHERLADRLTMAAQERADIEARTLRFRRFGATVPPIDPPPPGAVLTVLPDGRIGGGPTVLDLLVAEERAAATVAQASLAETAAAAAAAQRAAADAAASDAAASLVAAQATAGAIDLAVPAGVATLEAAGDGQVARVEAAGTTTGGIIEATLDARYGSALWRAPAIGRNVLINGDFDVWQRATSFGAAATTRYTADRWSLSVARSTASASRQAFAPGQIAVPGNPVHFYRTTVAQGVGNDALAVLVQRIEDVRPLSGGPVTLSFWAKADAPKVVGIEFAQIFGTGGSTSVLAIAKQNVSLTTQWQQYVVTVNLPSIANKVVGAASRLEIALWMDAGTDFATRSGTGRQSGTFDFARVQLEAGAIATPFERRLSADELALCQRYYVTGVSKQYSVANGVGSLVGGTTAFPVTLRATPTIAYAIIDSGNCNNFVIEQQVPSAIGWYATSTTASGGLFPYISFTADAEL